MAAKKIAILGWGSLIWDPRPDFDSQLNCWATGGPRLPLEFSRKSSSRRNALTLVIDSRLGTDLETFYALSKRTDTQDAICGLRCREGTTLKNIGFVDLVTGEQRGRDATVVKVILEWARAKDIQAATWTDLEPCFSEREMSEFFNAALTHLKALDERGIREAVRYVVMAPKQIETRFRKFLTDDEWFKEQVALHD